MDIPANARRIYVDLKEKHLSVQISRIVSKSANVKRMSHVHAIITSAWKPGTLKMKNGSNTIQKGWPAERMMNVKDT